MQNYDNINTNNLENNTDIFNAFYNIIQNELFIEEYISQIKILFEESNLGTFSIAYSPYNSGSYYVFATYLRNLGYIVDRNTNSNNINISYLNNYDLLVLANYYGLYDANELNTIKSWYEQGGNLLLIHDFTYEGCAKQVAQELGFNFSRNCLYDRDDYIYGEKPYCDYVNYSGVNIKTHEITKEVSYVEIPSAYDIITKPANTTNIIVTDNDYTSYYTWEEIDLKYLQENVVPNVSLMCALDNENTTLGKLVVIGDGELWGKFTGSNDPYFNGFTKQGNRKLALNIIKWLCNKNGILDLDTDSDNLTDYIETFVTHSNINSNDSDLDGLLDEFEFQILTNLNDNDTDSDGISDFNEVMIYSSSPILEDTDSDTLDDYLEIFILKSNPNSEDSDEDQIPDIFEYNNGLNLTDSSDAQMDFDNDQLTNYEEYMYWTDLYNPDTDGDNLTDYEEMEIYNSSPRFIFSDNDKLTDWEEVILYGTNPVRKDTDGDGYSDYDEVYWQSDPNDPNSIPQSFTPPDYPYHQPLTKVIGINLLLLIPSAFIFIKLMKKKYSFIEHSFFYHISQNS
ncbi:MAG: hypothetical protein ACFFDW_05100 [Candidatus Thorarchaeota archaeon]